jgi:hypothetical protein
MDIPKPIRQVEITLPSGILMMADWFRIPGFTEGVGKDDYSKPSINSDLGIDERTRDHYERLGLMRIHTGNCVPNLIKDGEAIRVGYFDEDHEAFWTEDGERCEVAMPEMAGRVCCDLWDVTFADREILIDILMAGAAAIEANGGIGDRDREVTGYPTSRERAGEMLDAYVKEHDLPRLEYAPGQALQITMASGHGTMVFCDKFNSPDVADWPAARCSTGAAATPRCSSGRLGRTSTRATGRRRATTPRRWRSCSPGSTVRAGASSPPTARGR